MAERPAWMDEPHEYSKQRGYEVCECGRPEDYAPLHEIQSD